MSDIVLRKRKALESKENHEDHSMESQRVDILYTNYKGERAWRRILPVKIWFGSTKWHPAEQRFVDAEDVDRQALRSFALCDIALWRSAGHGESDGSGSPDQLQ